jgi:hypothetical protein
MREKIKITVIISGGAVQDVEGITEDVMLTIRDYDVDEVMDAGVEQDEHGDWYRDFVWSEPSYEKKIIREPVYNEQTGEREEAALLQCFCGAEIQLWGFTNTCHRCGADFNSAGQHLAPRAQWGEETGEPLSDILRIQ